MFGIDVYVALESPDLIQFFNFKEIYFFCGNFFKTQFHWKGGGTSTKPFHDLSVQRLARYFCTYTQTDTNPVTFIAPYISEIGTL